MADNKPVSKKQRIPVGVSFELRFFKMIEDNRGNENRSKFISKILRQYFTNSQNSSVILQNKQKGLPVDESFEASNQQVKSGEVY